MSKKYLGENAAAYLVTLLRAALGSKAEATDPRFTDERTPTAHAAVHGAAGADPIAPADIGALAVSAVEDSLTSADPEKVLSARQGKVLAERIAGAGAGDMLKSAYDADDDGVVDNAAALEGHGADYFARAGEAAAYVAAQKGQPGGLAGLDADGKIGSAYLPSYVDDVVEGYFHQGSFYEDEAHAVPIQGERGKIYVDLTTNLSYRYGGSAYVVITSSDMVEVSNSELQSLWDAAR
jgi:hypothetical protein